MFHCNNKLVSPESRQKLAEMAKSNRPTPSWHMFYHCWDHRFHQFNLSWNSGTHFRSIVDKSEFQSVISSCTCVQFCPRTGRHVNKPIKYLEWAWNCSSAVAAVLMGTIGVNVRIWNHNRTDTDRNKKKTKPLIFLKYVGSKVWPAVNALHKEFPVAWWGNNNVILMWSRLWTLTVNSFSISKQISCVS